MVREIILLPEFTPGFVEIKDKIPKFQYRTSLAEELRKEELTQEKCIDLLKCMFFIRNLEEMIFELRENKGRYGDMKYLYIGATHLSIGQEAVSTGAVSAIQPDDYITSHHRGHGDALAKGYFAIKSMSDTSLINLITEDEKLADFLGFKVKDKSHAELVEETLRLHLFRAIAELFGKESGYCKGRGGSMHIADFSRGHMVARTAEGRAFRILTIIDEYTRHCLAILVDRRITSQNVIEQLFYLFVFRGVPEHIRSDNGPEFTAKAVRRWLNDLEVNTLFIERGSPWENGYIESFNGKLRDELLNREIFTTLVEASILIEEWRKEYNQVRPHSSLNYRPPAPEAIIPLTLT